MRRLLLCLLLAGCTQADLLTTPPGLALRQLASSMDDDSCLGKVLAYGDKDHDGRLTEREFVDLTLIAFDYAEKMDAKRAGHPSPTYEARRAPWAAKARKRFRAFDPNQDGQLDRTEILAACAALAHGDAPD